MKDRSAAEGDEDAVDVAVPPGRIGEGFELDGGGLGQVDVRGDGGGETWGGGESESAVGDADVLLAVGGGESGPRDVVRLGRGGGHHAGEAVDDEGEARVKQLNKFE